MYQGKDCASDHDMDREPSGMMAKMKKLMMQHYRRFKQQGLSDMEAMAAAKKMVKTAMQSRQGDDSAESRA